MKHKERMSKEEFEKAYDLFIQMCKVVYVNMEKGEYYQTCEDVFNGIERKHLDVSNIVSQENYEEFKRKLLNDGCGGIEMGEVPPPKYDTRTGEGMSAYCKDHPNMNVTF